MNFGNLGSSLTILNPGVAQSVDTLRLVLANDDIADSGSRQEVKDGIGVSSLGLLVAAALNTLVALHLPVECLAGVDVHGLVEDDRLLGDGELDTREGEARSRTATEVALRGISTTLRTIAVLATAKGSCR